VIILINNGTGTEKIIDVKKFVLPKGSEFVISVFLVIILGELIGSILCGNKSGYIFSLAGKLFDGYLNLISGGNFFHIFINTFIVLLFFYLFEFLSCSGIFGFITVYILALLSGLLHGSFAGYIYSCYQLQGITLNALLIVPFLLFNYLLFFNFSSESFAYSRDFFNLVFRNQFPESFSAGFRRMTLRMLLTVGASLLLSLVFAAFSSLLIKYFTF